MDIWIARDCDGVVAQYFGSEPTFSDEEYTPSSAGGFRVLPGAAFPEVKPGECRKAKITLEAEK